MNHTSWRVRVLTILAGVAWCWPVMSAERWAPERNDCNQQPTTLAIATCLGSRTKIWDGRLKQAYKALVTMLQDPDAPELKEQLAPLQAAQREWVKYRDANCVGYYGSQQGTIRQIKVESCLLDLTQARAIELHDEGPQ